MKTKRRSCSSTCSLSEVPRTGHAVSRAQREGLHRGAPDNTSNMNHKYTRADVLTELKHLFTAPPSVPTRRPPSVHRRTVADQGPDLTGRDGNKQAPVATSDEGLPSSVGAPGSLTSGIDKRQRRRDPTPKENRSGRERERRRGSWPCSCRRWLGETWRSEGLLALGVVTSSVTRGDDTRG